MKVSSPHLKSPQLPVEKLADNSHLSQPEKLHEVSRQFEAILLRQILGEAQKPVFKTKSAGSAVAGEVYQGLITEQLADQISRSGSFGLARGLETQLQHQLKVTNVPAATPSTDSQPDAPDASAPKL